MEHAKGAIDEEQRLMAGPDETSRPKDVLRERIQHLEDLAVDHTKRAVLMMGSRDANDSGPAVCAIWNLGSEAKRLAAIVERAQRDLSKA